MPLNSESDIGDWFLSRGARWLANSRFANYNERCTLDLAEQRNWRCHWVHVISRKTFKKAAQQYSGIEARLDTWFRVASKARWHNLEDIRKTYPSADGLKVRDKIYTVFNIGGNNFRLITRIEYDYQKVFIKDVPTHAEYNKEDWKK